MAEAVTRDTRVEVEIGGTRQETTWGEFHADNSDALDAPTMMLIAVTLAVGDVYEGGGGASPAWTIRRAA